MYADSCESWFCCGCECFRNCKCNTFSGIVGFIGMICLVAGSVTGGVILTPCGPPQCPNPQDPNLRIVPIVFLSLTGFAFLLSLGWIAIKFLWKKYKESKSYADFQRRYEIDEERRRQEKIRQSIPHLQDAATVSPNANVPTAPTMDVIME